MLAYNLLISVYKSVDMKRNYTLLILFSVALVASSFGQTRNVVSEELKSWDPVRGQWLAESMDAMAKNQPVPDRNFPENVTPYELFIALPADRKERIQREILRTEGQPNEGREIIEEDQRYHTVVKSFIGRRNCAPVMGRTYGDPHISSFDGKKFSFQTVGEFVLVADKLNQFEVQARQKPQSDQVSLNTAVAINVYGDRVTIYADDYPDNNRSTPVRINGKAVTVSNHTYFLPRGGTISNSGRTYEVNAPSGEKVRVDMRRSGGMEFMNIAVNVYPCNGMYFGVLGNANGIQNDDFGSDNTRIASSDVFGPFGNREFGRRDNNMEKEYLAFLARDFANQYRVTSVTSLFDYGFGESTWTFTDESFPREHMTLGDLSTAQRTDARRQCESQGIRGEDLGGCIYDVAYANIPPTPRPVVTERTFDEPLKPVTDPRPNVNKPIIRETSPPPGGRGESMDKKPIELTSPETKTEGKAVPSERTSGTPEVKETPAVERQPIEQKETEIVPAPKPKPAPVIVPKPKPAPKPVVVPRPKPKPVVVPKPKPAPSPKPTIKTPAKVGRG